MNTNYNQNLSFLSSAKFNQPQHYQLISYFQLCRVEVIMASSLLLFLRVSVLVFLEFMLIYMNQKNMKYQYYHRIDPVVVELLFLLLHVPSDQEDSDQHVYYL